jgi:two-component system, cell cycle sensor histidine kinase and response regulator CckA
MTPMVLVVDDEAIARNFIERALTQEGYQVVLASDGETALEILRSMDRKVALVITDLVMAGMGGHAFALEVGKLPSPPPLLYISAYEKPQGEMAKRFLQKPFSITDLTAAVTRLLPEMATRGSRV